MLVSIIIPLYNEEKYIKKCVESLLLQDYSKADMEWIFVDGCSTDRTRNILESYQQRFSSLIKIIENTYRTVPYAMNKGIESARGIYIIRLDAHANYQKDYISKCVYYLDNTKADNVGGLVNTVGNSSYGELIAKVLSSKFGVGNSKFRTNGTSDYVDTVPFGAFRKETFQKYGLYDVRLIRNQDIELNYRIRKNGGTIYLSNDICCTYYCRDTLRSFIKMNYENGKWNVITAKLCPGSMGIRHFVPLFFVLSILLLPSISAIFPLLAIAFGMELSIYMLLDIFSSIKSSSKSEQFLKLLILFPVLHVSYGFGSLSGLVKLQSL